jgi:enoyl-[acyl-carrier protein] reductase I
VNSVSAGPIKTLAASGIKGFKTMLKQHGANTPLSRNITAREVGDTVTFLLSDMAGGITGQTIYVDGGYNIQAMNLEQ